jgi:iron complex outermembrane receptor protein
MSSHNDRLGGKIREILAAASWVAAASCLGGNALAQSQSSAAAEGLEEIIVTAQKRAQAVQDVPMTISVLSSDMIAVTGAQSLSDLLRVIPAVSGWTIGVQNAIWAIRGMSSTTTDGGGEPSVGVYWDESYAGYLDYANTPIFDVARIEVAKGPQGTLFGKNATAGAISVYTNRPVTSGDSLSASIGAGNVGQLRGDFQGNVAINDQFAMRLSGMYDERGDYQRNMVAGGELGSYDSWGVRLGASWQPADTVQVYGYYQSWAASSTGWGGNVWDISGDTDPTHVYSVLSDITDKLEGNIVHVEVDWDVNEAWAIKSITDYRDSDYEWEADAAAIPVATLEAITAQAFGAPMSSILLFQLGGVNSRMYQQELRASWTGDDLFFVTGANYVDYRVEYPKTAAQLGLDSFGVRQVDWTGFVGPRKSLGIFADGTWDATDRLSISAGIRYTYDERDWTSYASSDTYLLPESGSVPVSFITGTSHLPIIDSGCETNILAPCLPPEGVSASESDSGWTPRLAFTYRLTDTLNVYGGIARGYKGGGFNTATDGVQPIGYDPETAMSYEAGLKGDSSNLRFSVALFYSEFSDLQVQTIVNSVAFTSNAATARSQGLEAEMQWQATDNLSMFANYAYVDAKYTKGVIYAGGETYDADGLKLVRSPENTANLGATFTGGLGEWGNWSFIPRLHYQSSQELSPVNRADFQEDGYTTFDARVTIGPRSDAWDVSLVGENLTGETRVYRIVDYLGLGATKSFMPDEALYRLEMSMRFGQAR